MAGNKRSNTAMVTALILGVHCCLPGMVAKAEGKSADAVKVQTSGDVRESILQGNLGFEDFTEGILGNQELLLKYTESFGENTKAEDKGLPGNDDSGLSVGKEQPEDVGEELQKEKKSLQMPQKLEVVIDPWEIDGKGQVYSDEYVIQNTGEDTGVLTLSNLTCIPREKSGAVIRTDRNGIHGDKRKSIYMELLFSTGERIILSEEGGRYEAELKPGEEVSLQFAGEVNEYADGNWDNEDIAVGVVYSWDMKEDTADTGEYVADTVKEAGKDDKSGDVSGDISKEKSGDASGDISKDNSGDVSGDTSGEEELRTVELDSLEEAELGVDSWAATSDGEPALVWYALRNTGKMPGILTLSEPVCIGACQDELTVKMILGSRERLQGSEKSEFFVYLEQRGIQYAEGLEKYVLIDLITEEERQAAGEEKWEVSEYQVKLLPGEEIMVCISGRMEGMALEEMEGGKTAVKVRYSWVMGEEYSGELED